MVKQMVDGSSKGFFHPSHPDDKVVVTQGKGYAVSAKVRGKIEGARPAEIYKLLVDQNNPVNFRSVKERKHFKLIESHDHGLRKYAVEYISRWNFLRFGGEMSTVFERVEDDAARRITMRMTKSGMLKKLDSYIEVEALDSHPDGALVTVGQSLSPKFPAFDPLSKQILKGTSQQMVREQLEDLRVHVYNNAAGLRQAIPQE